MAKFKLQYFNEAVEYCCGVRQIGSFAIEDVSDYEYKRYYSKSAGYVDDKDVAIEAGWERLKKEAERSKFPIQFWFVRYDNNDDDGEYVNYDEHEPKLSESYECDELRQKVKNHPGVIKLGCFVNPNTNNHVDGYMITEWATKGEEIA